MKLERLQICSTMKHATVRDLRNHYTKLLAWIDAGEEIAVSRRGVVIARLVPEKGKKPDRVDWEKSAAFHLDRSKLPKLSVAVVADLLKDNQGRY